MAHVSITDMSPEALATVSKFKMRKDKNIAAVVLKIDKASMTIVVDEELEDIEVSDLQDELPPQQPRFVALSYVQKHDDGRISYPLIFIFISPQGCSPEMHMMYAGSKLKLVKDAKFTKVIELRSLDDLTEETILDKLKIFK